MRHTEQPIQLHPGRHPTLANASGSAPASSDLTALVERMNRTFSEFVEANDRRLAEIEKRSSSDVVTSEKVDKINAEITNVEKALKDVNAKLEGARIGAGEVKGPASAAAKAHSDAFDKWFRTGDKGIEAQLPGLAVNATLTTDSRPDGGYVVPETVDQVISRVVALRSTIRQYAAVQTISGGNTFKALHNLGGAGSGWVGEQDSRTETNTPQLAELEYPIGELYAMPGATQNLLADARIDMGQWLADEVAIKFAQDEGAAFVSGNGNKKPYGFAGSYYSKVANASYSWGKVGYIATGVAAALSDGSNNGIDAILNLIYGLNRAYRQNATFLSNDLTIRDLRKLKDTTGQYLWQPSVQAGQPATLANYPIDTDDNFDDIGAGKYPLAFADWSRFYQIVDHFGTTVLQDPYTKKPYTLFYTTKRVGGGIRDFAAGKLLKVATS